MVAIIKFLFEVVEGIFGAIIEGIFSLIEACFSKDRKTEYTADFMPAGEVLSTYNKGFCLTGKRSLSIEASYSNALVIGGSGSGKSSRVLIPSILRMMGASGLVIHDPSGELFHKTSGALARAGYVVQSVNYAQPELSEGFNPLARAQSLSDIQKVSKLVILNSLGQSKELFWNTSSEALISLFSRFLVYHCPPEYRTLHNVLYLINVFGTPSAEKIDRIIVRTHDEGLIADYKAIVSYDSKLLMNIIATTRAALNIFSDPAVAKVTAHDTVDFKAFRHQKTALFINNSVSDMRYYAVITSIFLEQFFAEIMSRIPGNELPIFFLLDEASSMYFSSLNVVISNIRKSKAGILQIYQSASQIVDLYGQSIAKAITENSYAKLYMSGQPITVAQELERTLGKFEYLDDKDVRHIRPLMTADEIRQMDESLILCGNKPAIKARMKPYYAQYRLRCLSELPPVVPANKLPFDTPPLLKLD